MKPGNAFHVVLFLLVASPAMAQTIEVEGTCSEGFHDRKWESKFVC